MKILKIVSSISFILLFSACGQDKPKLVKVAGKLTHNGKPLTAGSIYFHPAQKNSFTKDNPSSILQEDGAFNMKTFPYGDGIPCGEYKITLAPQLASRILLPNLSDLNKSKFTITVPEDGIENLVLDVGTLKTK